MKCVERTELEQFLRGKLAPERLIAVDEHVRDCGECRTALKRLPTRAATASDFGASLLNVADCPEYEELSAFVDSSLATEQAKTLQAHANSCEFCSRDIESIREMRSHASLVDRVTVRPGASRARAAAPAYWWKRTLAAVSVAAAVAAAVFTFGPFGKTPMVAVKPEPPNTVPVRVGQPEQPTTVADNNHKPNPPEHLTPTPVPQAPAQVAVLKDGAYQVLEIRGKLVLARADGTPVKTAAPVAEKLAGNRVRPAKPVMMAMATLAEPVMVRGTNSTPPPSAPKLVSPLGKVVMTDMPTFAFSKVELAESYRVSIFTDGGTPVATEIAGSNSITLTKPLARGRLYKWRAGVRFSEGEEWAESAAGQFYVISSDDYSGIQQVKRQLPGSHLALGAAYERAGLKDEATGEYRLLRKQNPKSKLAAKF